MNVKGLNTEQRPICYNNANISHADGPVMVKSNQNTILNEPSDPCRICPFLSCFPISVPRYLILSFILTGAYSCYVAGLSGLIISDTDGGGE